MSHFPKKLGLWHAMLFCLIPVLSEADVHIIGKLGPTYPIKAILKNYSSNIPAKAAFDSEHYNTAHFPIRTPLMLPGIMKPRNVHYLLLNQPFYIIGDDTLSKRWLLLHAARLNKINAVGFIVNADSEIAVKRLEKAYKLTFIPIAGGAYAKNLGLMHYPVLVSSHRIEQ